MQAELNYLKHFRIECHEEAKGTRLVELIHCRTLRTTCLIFGKFSTSNESVFWEKTGPARLAPVFSSRLTTRQGCCATKAAAAHSSP